jgi:predicted methyltransferase
MSQYSLVSQRKTITYHIHHMFQHFRIGRFKLRSKLTIIHIMQTKVEYNSQPDPSFPNQVIFSPLCELSEDNYLFKLCEPNLDSDFKGPILEMQGMKMHCTDGMKNSLDFSFLLAEAAGVNKSHCTLDLFLGLGYTTKRCLQLGAGKVVTFEKYPEVIHLLKKNPEFSPSLQDQRIMLYPGRFDWEDQTMENLERIFKSLKCTFDSVIIDPPRRGVMLKIYSDEFLKLLAKYMKEGALVSVYSPKVP